MVVAAIGLIAALVMPAPESSRETKRRMPCDINMKEFGIGLTLSKLDGLGRAHAER
ncbi:hypothetical protein [Singulisphaera sp. PoT]|uniref:hypothetical protein n=1 Tax=Singulisphaera sp. PoT TaxID=3411797 RepID=UPI003BF5CADD